MDYSPLVTSVTTVWGKYDTYVPWWLGKVTALNPRPRIVIVHREPVTPTDEPGVTWVEAPADLFAMTDLGVDYASTPWVWVTAIDDVPTQEGWDDLHRVPADVDSMLISATFLDGSCRWDSDPATLLGGVGSYRMCGGCPFTVDFFRRPGGYTNPPEYDHLYEWGWYLRALAAGVRWHDATHVVGQLNTYNPNSLGRTILNMAIQEQQAHQYAKELGLI